MPHAACKRTTTRRQANRCFALAVGAVLVHVAALPAVGQDIATIRSDQIARLQDYVLDAIMPSGLVRDSLVLNPAASSFHPATPDAAGFALISLAAFDHLGTLPGADARVVDILRAYTGNTPGVTPERSPDGHYIHFMDINTGADPPGWDDSYSPIGSALVVAGAQFARNHFAGTDSPFKSQINSLTEELTDSIDFNAAIHPSLDGRIYLDMTPAGGGAGGTVRPWNEYQLVTSLALRQAEKDRAVAVKHLWLNTDNAPKIAFGSHFTLTDNPGRYAPAFWVQQAQFFNGDFRHDPSFQGFFRSAWNADRLYSRNVLEEADLHGLTAGVSPDGYHADRILDHPGTVFSPEAVAAWGDLNTLLDFYAEQPPASDPRYRYGLVRTSAEQPGWIPNDAGLVDHLFLLFGLVESLDPDFFADRVFAPLLDGDYNFDGVVDAVDYAVWRESRGSTSDLAADGDLDADVDDEDFAVWRSHFGSVTPAVATASASSSGAPEPIGLVLAIVAAGAWAAFKRPARRP